MMPVIKVEDIDPEIKKRFKQIAKRQGMTESELLRQMVARVIGKPSESENDIFRNCRVTLSFTEDEFSRIKKRSRADGFYRHTAWIVSVLRTVLLREPQFSGDEIAVIRESNRELSAIGRNLNQIARAINIDSKETVRLQASDLRNLRNMFIEHRKMISKLIDKCLNRWE